MDDKILFQKIFGISQDAPEAKEKLESIQKMYPYFIGPHYFKAKADPTNTDNPIFPLFIPSRIGLHYALTEEVGNTPDFSYSHFQSQYASGKKEETEQSLSSTTNLAPQQHAETVAITQTTAQANKKEEEGKVVAGLSDQVLPIANPETSSQPENTVDERAGQPADQENDKVPESTPENTPAEKAAASEELIFEPLHTTDYFASQGIRLSEEIKASDRLGTQLRSFTQWLKTMKKHPGVANKPGMVLDTPFDRKVESLAEKSNIEEEVITESMAEACIVQGKKQKAIEIYQKLSLQNPSKSAYFAAKIAGLSPGTTLA